MEKTLTGAQAAALIGMVKHFADAPGVSKRMGLTGKGQKEKFKLVSTEGMRPEFFTLDIFRSEKKFAKITFHHGYGEPGVVPLFRLDIGGGHTNPRNITENVPSQFARHRGERFDASHLHVYVEGFGLQWAIPLSESEFRDFADIEGFESNLQALTDKVRSFINLRDKLFYDQMLDYGKAPE